MRRVALALVLLAMMQPRPGSATAPSITGEPPAVVRDGFASGLFSLPAPAGPLGTSAATGEWVVPIIRVSFLDSALVHTPASLEHALFDTTGSTPDGSMSEYYRWASNGRFRVRGEVVATVQVPRNRVYYSGDAYGLSSLLTPNNDAGLVMDCLNLSDPQVDWNRFDRDHDGYVDMVWILHAGPGAETNGVRRDFWSITSSLSSGWSNAGSYITQDLLPGSMFQHMRVDRFSMVPELSGLQPGALAEIGIFCHEFGHALGLPDLYDTASLGGAANVGPGVWSLMSTGTYGGDGRSPQRPTNLGAWPLLYLGWATRLRPVSDTTLTLPSVPAGGPVAELWCSGESNPEHFLIEHRTRTSFDRDLPQAGLLVYQIDEALVGARLPSNRVNYGPDPALRVLEGDGDQDLIRGANRGDANDPLPGALGITQLDDDTTPSLSSLSGAPTNLGLRDLVANGTSTTFRMVLRSPGWGLERAYSADTGVPIPSLGPAARIAQTADGNDYSVTCELRDAATRVLVRRRFGDTWGDGVLLDDGVLPANDPTIAALPGGDLVVAWAAGAAGNARIAIRTRIAGTWTPVTMITPASHAASSPSLAADASGRVCLAWLGRTGTETTRVWFMRFLYSSPFGQPIPLTSTQQLPAAPQVVCDAQGTAHVIWPEHSVFPVGLYFSRSHPDSMPSAPLPLVFTTIYPQLSFNAAVDGEGTLHTLWHISGVGVSEIHWQRRPRAAALVPRDSTIDSQGDGLRDPAVFADPQGALHAVWLRAQPWGSEVRYGRWRPARGWDSRSTPLTTASSGSADHPVVVARGPDDLTMVYLAHSESSPVLRTRSRRSDGVVNAAPDGMPRAPGLALGLAPNPVRSGMGVRLSRLSSGERVVIFDTQGRRRATLLANAAGEAWLDGRETRTWPSGIYFARALGGPRSARMVVVR